MKATESEQVRQAVRERYGKIAEGATQGCCDSAGTTGGCCSPGMQPAESRGQIIGYESSDLDTVVEGANMDLGCGNPVAIARLKPGETVLDLGSGGGFDSFLAARAVGNGGFVIGVDMTVEMVAKARRNASKMDSENISFRLGEIEYLPVADTSVDVILSNCVINLSPDKPQVWKEAYRVLKPGGRLAISDVVATAPIPDHMKEGLSFLTGCVSGAEEVDILRQQLIEAGFEKVSITIKPGSRELIGTWFPNSGAEAYVASADIEAYRPSAC